MILQSKITEKTSQTDPSRTPAVTKAYSCPGRWNGKTLAPTILVNWHFIRPWKSG